MSIVVISRKAYRFNHPGRRSAKELLRFLTEASSKGKSASESGAYCEVHPGAAPGAFGNPVQLPDWAASDGMFKAALANRNLVILNPGVLQDPEEVKKPIVDSAAVAATLAAAERHEDLALGGEQVSPNSTTAVDREAALESAQEPIVAPPQRRRKAS